jgi:RNA polymerase sigma-70 factor (ECF subfamily)
MALLLVMARGMESDLTQLLVKVAQGDRAAFASLYDAVSGRLYAVVLRILPRAELAEDALQEAFVRIWQRASSYDKTVASPMAWMATIARNQAIDLRRRSVERIAAASDEIDGMIPDPGLSPEAVAEQSGDWQRLIECMSNLPPDRRDMVLLAYRNGFSREELATRFRKPVTTVKTLLRRSLIALRECLGGR